MTSGGGLTVGFTLVLLQLARRLEALSAPVVCAGVGATIGGGVLRSADRVTMLRDGL